MLSAIKPFLFGEEESPAFILRKSLFKAGESFLSCLPSITIRLKTSSNGDR